MQGEAPRKRKRKRERQLGAVGERDGLELAVVAVQVGDFAAVADRDAVAVELLDQVVRHRLAEVGAAVQEGDQGAAAGQPDRRLGGRVAAADDADPLAAAELRLGRAGGVEDADPLVARRGSSTGRRRYSAPGREQHRPGGDLVAVLELDQVALAARLERAAPGRASPCGRRTCAPG